LQILAFKKMEYLTEKQILAERIRVLSDRQSQELIVLREQFYITYDSLKPLNIIKNTFREVTSSGSVKNDLLGGALGLTTGFLSKKVLLGASHNPLALLAGTILQFAVGNVVAKHSDTIISKGANFFQRFLKTRTNGTKELYHTKHDGVDL